MSHAEHWRASTRALALLLWLLPCLSAIAGERSQAPRPEVEAFIEDMVNRHGMAREDVRALLRNASVRREVLRAMSAQATPRPWHQYRPAHVNAERIRRGVLFWREHEQVLTRAESEFGVPAEIIVATIGVETIYGGYTGTHRVLDALVTLAFDFPRRAQFFRGELEAFLLLARDRVVDPLAVRGSFAGAIGIPQFLPSSIRRYAVDFDGDGRIDLTAAAADSIGSVANYYREFGWRTGRPIAVAASVDGDAYLTLAKRGIEPNIGAQELRAAAIEPREDIDGAGVAVLVLEGVTGPEVWLGLKNFYVITRYNRSVNYAMSVFQLAGEIRARRAEPIR